MYYFYTKNGRFIYFDKDIQKKISLGKLITDFFGHVIEIFFFGSVGAQANEEIKPKCNIIIENTIRRFNL